MSVIHYMTVNYVGSRHLCQLFIVCYVGSRQLKCLVFYEHNIDAILY